MYKNTCVSVCQIMHTTINRIHKVELLCYDMGMDNNVSTKMCVYCIIKGIKTFRSLFQVMEVLNNNMICCVTKCASVYTSQV